MLKRESQSAMSMTNSDNLERFPDNANCERTHATLRVVHADLDPEMITQSVGIAPDAAHKRGEMRLSKSGKKYPYPRGIWNVSTRGWSSRNLEAHIVRLLERVEPSADRIRNVLRTNPEYRFEIMCFWMSATGQGGPSLSPDTLSRIAALGATLDFDIYSAV
jgi:hypothetical protein